MNFSKLKYIFPFLLAALFLTGCDDDDPVIENEEEIITTLSYTLTPISGDAVTFTFQDIDGDGGDAPIITNGTLAANTVYSGALSLLNESESPAEDINPEIEEEDDEHQFFFANTVSGLTIEYSDTDGNGNPIGLATTLSTGDAGSGNLTITLRHMPDKTASGVTDGNIDNAGGETDIEVTFDVSVQ